MRAVLTCKSESDIVVVRARKKCMLLGVFFFEDRFDEQIGEHSNFGSEAPVVLSKQMIFVNNY